MMKVIHIERRSKFNNFCFVLFYDTNIQKYKARFEKVTGSESHVEEDMEHVRDHGVKMSYEEAKGFFPYADFGKEQYKN